MVRLACDRCDRKGQYRRDTLIEKFGLEVTMPDLRHLIARCPRHNVPGQACGVYYSELGVIWWPYNPMSHSTHVGFSEPSERFTTMSIFQRLYDSEINFEVSGFYDAGFDVNGLAITSLGSS